MFVECFRGGIQTVEAIIVCWDKETERYEAMEFHWGHGRHFLILLHM